MQKAIIKTALYITLMALLTPCFSTGWHFCNQKEQKTYLLQHFDITNLPTQVKPNSRLRVSVTGLNTSTITKGDKTHFPYITVKLGYNNKYIVNRKEKICNHVKCPIKKGMISYLIRTRIHSLAPSGNYSLHIKLMNSDNKTLTCIIGNVHIENPVIPAIKSG
jgi:hypothetical protein